MTRRHAALTLTVAAAVVILLASLPTARASCEVETFATVSGTLQAGRPRPTTGTGGFQRGSFFVARDVAIEHIGPSGTEDPFVVPPPRDGRPSHPSAFEFTFSAPITGLRRIANRSSLLLLTNVSVYEVLVDSATGSPRPSEPVLVATFVPNATGAGAAPLNGRLAASQTHVYVMGRGCVLSAPLPDTPATSAASAPPPVEFTTFAGVCGSPLPDSHVPNGLVQASGRTGSVIVSSSDPMPTPQAIMATEDGDLVGIVLPAYVMARQLFGDRQEAFATIPTTAVGSLMTAYDEGPLGLVYAAQVLGTSPCVAYWDGFSTTNSHLYGEVTPEEYPTVCDAGTNAAIIAIDHSGALGYSRDDYRALIADFSRSAAGELSILSFDECSKESNPEDSSDDSSSPSAAAQNTSDSNNTGLIIGLSVGGTVSLVVIAAIVGVIVVRRSGNAENPPAEKKEMSQVTLEQQASAESAASRTIPAQPLEKDRSRETVPTPHVAINVSAASDTGGVRGANNSSRAADISAMKRQLTDTATSVQHVTSAEDQQATQLSALSHGDFLRSAEAVGADKARLLRLRAWSDAELIRHNRRCEAVKNDDYRRGKLLGRGANGSVFAAVLPDGSTVAMKEVNLTGTAVEVQRQINDVANEMALLSRLHHDNLVTYYGVVCDREMMQVRLFMELVTGGSLAGLVQEMDAPLPEQTAQKYVRQIVRGLAYIHEHGVIHRDLKCDNIMRDASSGAVKLADFGTAKSVGNATGASRAAQTMIGTPYFMAPEILAAMTVEDAEAGYGVKADIWSLGITVAELLNRGNPPWPSFPTPAHAFLHIANPESKPVLPEHISGHAADFIGRCCERDPRTRATAMELLEHPWMQTILDDEDDDAERSAEDLFERSRRRSTNSTDPTAPTSRRRSEDVSAFATGTSRLSATARSEDLRSAPEPGELATEPPGTAE